MSLKIGIRSRLAERLSLAVLALNVLGVIAYLLWASQTWVIPQERGMSTTTAGDALVWGAFVLPLFAAFFIVNLAWGSLIIFQRRWRTGRLWLATFFVWMGAIVIDVVRHH